MLLGIDDVLLHIQLFDGVYDVKWDQDLINSNSKPHFMIKMIIPSSFKYISVE